MCATRPLVTNNWLLGVVVVVIVVVGWMDELTGGAGAGRGEQIAILILARVLVDDHVVQSNEILILVVEADRDES